jgi:biotin carboxyl carrier protein
LPDLVEVKAPISGIFYRAPAPSAPPFVDIGTTVRKGQAMALLEAMKLFTKIKAPADGVVSEIVGVDARPVSSGDVLFVLQSR